jgi:hypothetical protein
MAREGRRRQVDVSICQNFFGTKQGLKKKRVLFDASLCRQWQRNRSEERSRGKQSAAGAVPLPE